MSTWREKAIEILPGLKKEFNRKDLSIYDVFIELLPATVDAHKQKNKDLLKKYYGYAKWCLQQKEKQLWNAAGVAFYEELGDYAEIFSELHLWIDREVYSQIKELLQSRLSAEKFPALDKHFR